MGLFRFLRNILYIILFVFTSIACLFNIFILIVLLKYAEFQQGKNFVIVLFVVLILLLGALSFLLLKKLLSIKNNKKEMETHDINKKNPTTEMGSSKTVQTTTAPTSVEAGNISPSDISEKTTVIDEYADNSLTSNSAPVLLKPNNTHIDIGSKYNEVVTPISNKSFMRITFSSIPNNILELLYIKGGAYSNYTPELINEPSLINTSLEISSDINENDKFIDIGYYPSYARLSPKQRYIYINWLSNISSPIAIGYVFIFYYGLERQLLFGNFERAYSVLLTLKHAHNNTSFQSYSNDALLLSSLYHKDYDKLQIIDTTGSDWSIRILVDYLQGKKIVAEHIIGIRRKVGFENDRYIKLCPDLFNNTLKKNIVQQFGSSKIPLEDDDFLNCKENCILAIANYSLRPGQRFSFAPDITTNEKFKCSIYTLLCKTHEDVKSLRRKKQ